MCVCVCVCVRVCACVAVRTGNLSKFNQVLEQFGEKFQTDGTYTLIIRLRHNVIKTGEPITKQRPSPNVSLSLFLSQQK